MPTLSVNVIGLLVAAVMSGVQRTPPGRTLLYGLLGAWAGFAIGALVGILVDVVLGTGFVLAICGHVAAFAGSAGLIRSRARQSSTPTIVQK